jgi:hypothetical protein
MLLANSAPGLRGDERFDVGGAIPDIPADLYESKRVASGAAPDHQRPGRNLQNRCGFLCGQKFAHVCSLLIRAFRTLTTMNLREHQAIDADT